MSEPAIVYVSGTTESVKVTSSGAIDLVEVTTTYGGGSGGGGAVDSVNGKTGVVVLDAADVGAAEVVNVLDFGADPTGVADSWLAIQQSIYQASWQWQAAGWPATEDLTGEDETHSYVINGASYDIPDIWAGQGHQTVYLPAGTYRITKPLVITNSTKIRGDGNSQTTIMPDQHMRGAGILSKNLAIYLKYPDSRGEADIGMDYNAGAHLSDFQVRRKLSGATTPVAATTDLTEWLCITSYKLEGAAGDTTLLNRPNTGYPLVASGRELPIRMRHEWEAYPQVDQIYTVTRTEAANTVISPALVTSTPAGGAGFLVGIPAIKGIFVSGGEDFVIERVDTPVDPSGVGIFVWGGSPGPSIRNCMSSQNKVGFWVDNYPVLLDCPSGDGNETFIKGGCLRYTVLTILSYKCEGNLGDMFQFGGMVGSDSCQYTIIGGAVESSAAVGSGYENTAVINIALPNAASRANFPVVNCINSRFYINRTKILRATDKYWNQAFSVQEVAKSAIGSYPSSLFWTRGSATMDGYMKLPDEALNNPLNQVPYYTLPTGTGYLALSDSASGVDSRITMVANATSSATANTIPKRDANAGFSIGYLLAGSSGSAIQLGDITSGTDLISGEWNDVAYAFRFSSITSPRLWTMPDADGKLALTANTDGAPDALFNATISGTVAFGTGAAANMLTALGVQATGKLVLESATPAAANSVLGIETKTLAADETGVTNTTFVIANGFTTALAANTTYKIEFYFRYTSNGGHFKAEIRLPALAGPTTATNVGYVVHLGGLVALPLASSVIPVTTYAGSVSGASAQGIIFITTGATPGDLTCYWAQQTTSANATVLKSGSNITVTAKNP